MFFPFGGVEAVDRAEIPRILPVQWETQAQAQLVCCSRPLSIPDIIKPHVPFLDEQQRARFFSVQAKKASQ